MQEHSPHKPFSCLARFLSAAPPFHFINHGIPKSCLSLLWPPLPPPSFMFQPLPRPSAAFLDTFYAYSFFFSVFSKKKNQPFLFHCFFCVVRQPCNCGPCEERDETRPCVGRHRASVPTYSHSPSRVFVPAPL